MSQEPKPRELARLVDAGYGKWNHDLDHPRLGNGLWEYRMGSLSLFLFSEGISASDGERKGVREILFAEISGIKSHLTAQAIARAAEAEASEFVLPLEIFCRSDVVVIALPITIYSAFIIAIQQFRAAARQ